MDNGAFFWTKYQIAESNNITILLFLAFFCIPQECKIEELFILFIFSKKNDTFAELKIIKDMGMETDIGKNLRKIRVSKKKSQQEVADHLGVERKTYGSWEAGTTKVKSSTLQQLAEFFKVDIKEFYKEKPSNIVINQTNTDNKEHSVNNGIIIFLNDKETFNELVTLIKKQFGNTTDT